MEETKKKYPAPWKLNVRTLEIDHGHPVKLVDVVSHNGNIVMGWSGLSPNGVEVEAVFARVVNGVNEAEDRNVRWRCDMRRKLITLAALCLLFGVAVFISSLFAKNAHSGNNDHGITTRQVERIIFLLENIDRNTQQ